MDMKEIADRFARGQDCSQVVLECCAERLGMNKKDANLLSAGFGGGTGIGETCGVIIGAMIALGMKYGNNGPDDMDQKNIMIAKRIEFIEAWKKKRDHTMCKDFLGHDVSIPGEFEKVVEEGTMFTLCPLLALDALEILDSMLAEPHANQ